MTLSLLLHCNGTNGSTTIPDSVTPPNTVTCHAAAALSTAQAKFGTASVRFNGVGDFISVPAYNGFNFGSAPFTMECQAYWVSNAAVTTILMQQWGVSGQLSWILYHTGGNTFHWIGSSTGNTTSDKFTASFTPTLNTWYTIALDWDGTTYRFYVNGVVLATATGAISLWPSTTALNVGSDFNGYIDEIRIDKGQARFAGAYTPTTSEYALTASNLRAGQSATLLLAEDVAATRAAQVINLALGRHTLRRVMTKIDTRN